MHFFFNIEKQCNRCGKVLPITEFFKSAKSKDGYKTIYETTKYKLNSNFNEQEMTAKGWIPVYDDGQTLIY